MARLSDEMCAFLELGVAHQIGGVDADGRPCISRAVAAQVIEDGRLEVLISGECGFEVLGAVRATGRVSAVFVHPSTYRTLHIKGTDAQVTPAGEGYRPLLDRRRAAFARELQPYGFNDGYLSAWYTIPEGALMCIRFTPTGAWNQTPGPGAGSPLELRPEPTR